MPRSDRDKQPRPSKAHTVPYRPADGSDWTDPDPKTIGAALDAIAAAAILRSFFERKTDTKKINGVSTFLNILKYFTHLDNNYILLYLYYVPLNIFLLFSESNHVNCFNSY